MSARPCGGRPPGGGARAPGLHRGLAQGLALGRPTARSRPGRDPLCAASSTAAADDARRPRRSSSAPPWAAAALGAGLPLLLPLAAHAGEAAPPGFLALVMHTVDGLGPWGPVAFAAAVGACELIPMFPTTPLSLASGLLFGAHTGALCVWAGNMFAATLAFVVARGVGRPIAERIVRAEIAGGGRGAVQRRLAEAERSLEGAIERGSPWQQGAAVLALRLTPVIPYSAANYVLGLSPMPAAPYLAGTAAGTALWSAVYASLGGASRALLARGAPADALLAELVEKAGEYSGAVAAGMAGAGAVAGAIYMVRSRRAGGRGGGGGSGGGGGDGGGAAARPKSPDPRDRG